MRRSRLTLVLVAGLAVAFVGACSDASAPGPIEVDPSFGRSGPPGDAAIQAEIEVLINQLFPQPERSEALALFAQVMGGVASDDAEVTASAVAALIDLSGATDLNDPPGPETAEEGVTRLFELLFGFAGLDGAVETVGSGGAIVTTESGEAGVEVPSGAVDDDAVIVITEVPVDDPADCLPTGRPQRLGCYDFETIPELSGGFNVDVTVGICFDSSGLTPEQEEWYHLYSFDEGDPNVELLPSATVSFLDCSGFLAGAPPANPLLRWAGAGWSAVRSVIGPTPLHATDSGGGGLIGAFSRIGWAQNTVLIYGPSLTPQAFPSSEDEETISLADGHNAVVVDGATWAGMSATGVGGFGDFDVLAIGNGGDLASLGDAESNTSVWGPVVTGRVVVNSVHAPFHFCDPNTDADCADEPAPFIWHNPEAVTLVSQALAWASRTRGTGFYAGFGRQLEADPAAASLPGLVVDVLDPFFGTADFKAVRSTAFIPPGDQVDFLDASHPILSGIAEADLSGWVASYHTLFSSVPGDFVPIARGFRDDDGDLADSEAPYPVIVVREP